MMFSWCLGVQSQGKILEVKDSADHAEMCVS